jgi:hypothetical protein
MVDVLEMNFLRILLVLVNLLRRCRRQNVVRMAMSSVRALCLRRFDSTNDFNLVQDQQCIHCIIMISRFDIVVVCGGGEPLSVLCCVGSQSWRNSAKRFLHLPARVVAGLVYGTVAPRRAAAMGRWRQNVSRNARRTATVSLH